MDRWNKAQHSLRGQAHMCFYICSGYFNLMLNKRRLRLKDNNVSSSAQASPPEWVIAHQQAGGRACKRAGGRAGVRACKRGSSAFGGNTSRAVRGEVDPVSLPGSGSISLSPLASSGWLEEEYRCQPQRGGGVDICCLVVSIELCLKVVSPSIIYMAGLHGGIGPVSAHSRHTSSTRPLWCGWKA